MGNGLGPAWFPARTRAWLTSTASYFFKEASWDIHDEGYEIAKHSRWHCDFRFLQEMLSDAADRDKVWKIFVASTASFGLWGMVRAGGWTTYGIGVQVHWRKRL